MSVFVRAQVKGVVSGGHQHGSQPPKLPEAAASRFTLVGRITNGQTSISKVGVTLVSEFALCIFHVHVLVCFDVLARTHVYKAKSHRSTGSEPDGDDTFSLCDTTSAFLDQFRSQVGLFICCAVRCALCAYSPTPTLVHAIL